jgi:two-component system OmpR family sensor kinase
MRRRPPISLRNRISLVLVAVVAIALVAANLVVYAMASRGLDRRVEEHLQRMGEFTDSFVQAINDGEPLPEGTPPPLPQLDRGERPGDRGEYPGGQYVGIRLPDGSQPVGFFIDRDFDDADREPPEIPDDLALESGEMVFVDTWGQVDGRRDPYRMRVSALDDGTLTLLAIPTADVDRDRRELAQVQFVAGLTVLVLLALLTRWLVGISLRPLARMEGAAERIADGDLTHRVEPSGPQTEISRFGATLNRMLGEIEQAFVIKEDSERRLRASEKELRRFVADASHEMRTPLTSIRGYAQLLHRDRIDDASERSDAAGRIEGQATRLSALVDDLLLLARLDGDVPLRQQSVDVDQLVGQVVDDARVVDPDRVISFEADGGVTVHGDPDALTRVLTNLVANACRHTPSGSPVEVVVHGDGGRDRVGDGAGAGAGGAGEVKVDVVDHGPGVSDELRPQLFTRFFRTDQSRSRDRGGAGLGLAIVAGILTAHGGRCELHDTPGGGATFRVVLPRAL